MDGGAVEWRLERIWVERVGLERTWAEKLTGRRRVPAWLGAGTEAEGEVVGRLLRVCLRGAGVEGLSNKSVPTRPMLLSGCSSSS